MITANARVRPEAPAPHRKVRRQWRLAWRRLSACWKAATCSRRRTASNTSQTSQPPSSQLLTLPHTRQALVTPPSSMSRVGVREPR